MNNVLSSIVSPAKPASNTDTALLKVIAMITMVMDHVGKMFFAAYPVMRMIGRVAFPIYAYCIAIGAIYTKNPLRYVSRMVLLALISQPFYAVGLAHTTDAMYAVSFMEHPLQAIFGFYINSWNKPSIFFTLILGLLLVLALREHQYPIAAGMLLFCWLAQNSIDYGFKGILLILLFYLFAEYPIVSALAVSALMIWWGAGAGSYKILGISCKTQIFALAALPLIYIPTESGWKLPKWLFYSFYPVHLLVIILIMKLGNG